jgi:hypothetical protein
MIAILGLMMPLASGIMTPIVKAWSEYKRTQPTTNEAGFAAGVAGDVQTTRAPLQADVADNAIKARLYGSGVYRFVEWFVGGLVAIHFGLVFLSTILASKFLFGRDVLGVPQAPGAYGGSSNVARWLGQKS